MESIIGNSRRPDVTFYVNGRIDITSRVARILQLNEGDVIDIGLQQGEYYLYVKNRANTLVGKHEAQCSASKKKSMNFRAYSKKLSSAVLAFSKSDKARIPIGEVVELPNIGWAVSLIIRNNLA